MAVKKQCNKIGCSNLIPRNQNPPYCEDHIQEIIKLRSKYRSDKKDDYDTFYKSKAWRKTREYILLKHNYTCVECAKRGILTFADAVHHIKHLREPGGWELRLSDDNLVPLCNTCHNKEHTEKGGHHNG